jgi:hypothetical protein
MKACMLAALIGVVVFAFAPAVALAGICFSVTGLPRPAAVDLALLAPSATGQIPFVGEAYGVCGAGTPPAPVQGTVSSGVNPGVFRVGLRVSSHRLGCSGTSAEIVFQPPYTSANGQWHFQDGSIAAVVLTQDPTGNACQIGTAPAGACVDSATTLCLQQKRFSVTGSRINPSPPVPGQVVRAGSESGHMHSGNPDNLEMLIKVLNGCTQNNRYWVFAAPLTDVRYTITVTDTQTGNVKIYTNPPGSPVQDTSAFATCP